MGRKRKKISKKNYGKKSSPKPIISGIVRLLDLNPGKGLNSRQIIRSLAPESHLDKELIESKLNDLVNQGKLSKSGNKYFSAHQLKTHEGIVDHVNSQYAFVMVEGMAEDIMVRAPELGGAWHEDRVRVQVNPANRKRDGRRTGRVVEIIERKRTEFVGKLEIAATYGFVVPSNKKLHQDIFIPGPELKKAKDGSIVLVKIEEWGDRHRNPEGSIIDVLGLEGENDAEMHAIMLEYGLPYKFSGEVEQEAGEIPEKISATEIKKRKDFRNVLTITIDPEDAKDFDDAISLEYLSDGLYRIGVHIADVTHYLQPGTSLDKEAYRRGTSVYLVDRTIPMLPEKLSNNLCSLRPNEDRLAFSAVFDMDKNGEVKEEWYGKTVIHSNRRFTYEEAQQRIEKKEGDYAEEVVLLNEIAKRLQKDRFNKGSISFETTELKFKLDETGYPIEVAPKERKDAHKMIEDFMLLANKKVAALFRKKEGEVAREFVFRTHDWPDQEKLENFSLFAKNFGYSINISSKDLSKELNQFNAKISGKPEESVLQGLAIRSMAKAKYTRENSGHFGLGFKDYTHFTSPIRRYPDVMVHRFLQEKIIGHKQKQDQNLEKKCQYLSEKEKSAAEAERASVKYKQVEFMQDQIGAEYIGIVSGVTDFGIYVEISEMKCEGMIRIRDILDDFFVAEPHKFRVIGQQSGMEIRIGDEVMVEVTSADLNKRTIDLSFISKHEQG